MGGSLHPLPTLYSVSLISFLGKDVKLLLLDSLCGACTRIGVGSVKGARL